MKKIIFLLFIMFFPQNKIFAFLPDTTNPLKSSIRYREEIPFALKISLDGVGIDYTFSPFRINIEVSSVILVQGLRVKYFFSSRNSTPLIGLGVGNKYASFGGNGESNQWSVIFAGWQFNFKRFFCDAGYQYIIYEENKKSTFPPVIYFGMGFRIF